MEQQIDPYQTPETELCPEATQVSYPGFFSIAGRIGRLRYLVYLISFYIVSHFFDEGIYRFIAFISLGSDMNFNASFYTILEIYNIISSAVVLIVFIVLSRRRLHDLSHSSWFMLLALLPLINILLLVYLLTVSGTTTSNRFGLRSCDNPFWIQALGGLYIGVFLISSFILVMNLLWPAT